MIVANNPALTTWLSVPKNSDFPIQSIPFGIVEDNGTRYATRIGDTSNLSVLFESGIFDGILQHNYFSETTLNSFFKTK